MGVYQIWLWHRQMVNSMCPLPQSTPHKHPNNKNWTPVPRRQKRRVLCHKRRRENQCRVGPLPAGLALVYTRHSNRGHGHLLNLDRRRHTHPRLGLHKE